METILALASFHGRETLFRNARELRGAHFAAQGSLQDAWGWLSRAGRRVDLRPALSELSRFGLQPAQAHLLPDT